METLQAEKRAVDYPVLWRKISGWISKKADEAWIEWLVVWVSGWIDSAVVSTLSAMSGKALTLLELPIHQNSEEVSRAREHIEWLQKKFSNVSSQLIDLSTVYDTMQGMQYAWENRESEYLADVNMRSRLRTVQLYATANRENALVVWTGNKVEDYGIWFFTKYWDWAVDISPIWELYKSEVYRLWWELGVLNSILEAKPTDWLHPTWATDEDQIWATYDELEWAMEQYDLWKRSSEYKWRKKEVMSIYSNRHKKNDHKMSMPPVYQFLDDQN